MEPVVITFSDLIRDHGEAAVAFIQFLVDSRRAFEAQDVRGVYDPDDWKFTESTATSRSGVVVRYARADRERTISGQWVRDSAADAKPPASGG